jgi:LysR family transcriptional activator of nhaA
VNSACRRFGAARAGPRDHAVPRVRDGHGDFARAAIVAELDDDALAKTFGEAGLGVFVAPDVVRKEVSRRYGVELVGRAKAIGQRFYAISLERKITHPAVAAICDAARAQIFA